jgi:sn-glycerol 3-phosphate transport system substrate-binding protein
VRVNIVFQGSYDETADKYLGPAGRDLPSSCSSRRPASRWAIDSQAMLPVQACVDAAGYDLSDHLGPWSTSSPSRTQLWPMPFNTSNPVLYYNTTMFEGRATDDDVPTTLDELRDVSQRSSTPAPRPPGFALELSPWYLEQWFAKANEPLVDNDNGRSERATEHQPRQRHWGSIFTFIDDMVDDGLAMNVGRNPGASTPCSPSPTRTRP